MIKALLAVTAAAMLLGGCADGSEDNQPMTNSDEVVFAVEGGKRTEGPAELDVDKGDEVVLRVTGDAPDELHVHGYDLKAQLDPSKPAVLRFTANLPGVWEVELHHSGAVLTELRVNG